MDGEELRAASRATALASSSSSNTSTAQWTLKLPFLCARPGNVGVQIDSYRAMTIFNRPRCGKFTEHFLGMQFENGSMENYSRVVERTSKRARIVEDRLAKLRAREHEILEDEQRRQQKRHERELARQKKIWLHHQSLKKREQRQREAAAAVAIQRCVRGMLARHERDVWLQETLHDRAARTLQRSSRSFVTRRRSRKRALERQKEKQMQAATVLQRQTRKRLALAARKRLEKLEHQPASPVKCEAVSSIAFDAAVESQSPPVSPAKSSEPPRELDRNISLDLLFSDGDDDESPHPPRSSDDTAISLAQASAYEPMHASPQLTYQPKRPVSIKRVGGGFRATSFPPTKAPRAYAQQQSARRVVHSQHVAATATANRPIQSPLLSLASRRPSVPSSPGSFGTTRDAPKRRSSAGEAQQAGCSMVVGGGPLPFDSDALLADELSSSPPPLAAAAAIVALDDSEFALEELVEAYARTHVADSVD